MDIDVAIKKALPGFSLDVSLKTPAKRVGLLGASGAGKSMLLRCISGLVKPDQGRITIGGKTLYDSEKRINLHPRERKVGFLFQNYALFPHMTIQQNITFGLDALPQKQKEEIAARLMEKFHLHDIGQRYPSQISGGQQQRVAFARALAVEPEILLLDEPFSALDDHLRAHMIKEMLEDLKDFRGSVLLVTHNIDEVYRICGSLAIMNKGSIESFGPKEKMFQQPQTLETARITGCKNLTRAVRETEKQIRIDSWGIKVRTASEVEAGEGFAGVHANHIRLADEHQPDNTFRAWIADRSETPFRITLYMKLNSQPIGISDYHLQWEISREAWRTIRALPQPLRIHLPAEHMFYVNR